jgi:hypothetical protein
MTRIQNLQRRDLVLLGICVVLVAILILRPSPTSAVSTESLPALFPKFDKTKARAIVLHRIPPPKSDKEKPVSGGLSDMRLERQGEDKWVVKTAFDYPANPLKVQSLLEALEGAKVKSVATTRKDTFENYAPREGWLQVKVLGAGESELVSFRLGKTATWPDSYALLGKGDGDEVVRAYNLTSDKARMTVDAWAEARLWPSVDLPNVKKIDVFQRDEKKTISLVREEASAKKDEGKDAGHEKTDKDKAPETTWRMTSPSDEKAETLAVENLVRSFTGMRFKDILSGSPDAAKEKEYGLDDPAYRVTVTVDAGGKEPKIDILEIGKQLPDEDGKVDATSAPWAVRRKDGPWVFSVTNASVADFRKAPEDLLPKPVKKEGEEGKEGGEKKGAATGTPKEGATENGTVEATGSPDGDAEGTKKADGGSEPKGSKGTGSSKEGASGAKKPDDGKTPPPDEGDAGKTPPRTPPEHGGP